MEVLGGLNVVHTTKVTYIGTDENELELEKKGVKPDYYEYDQAIATETSRPTTTTYKQRGTKTELCKPKVSVQRWARVDSTLLVDILTSG